MTEPEYVPDAAPTTAWPADLPQPVAVDEGECVRYQTTFEATWRHGPWTMGEVQRRSGAPLALLAKARDAIAFDWSRALFLDLEVGTHPRGGACLYLAGTARFIDGALVLTQRLARDADGERALLIALAAELAQAGELVTYAGKSFDAPTLVARAAAHQVELSLPPRHFDLYRMAGKLLRKRYGDQKLVTFERELLRFDRGEDLPGSALPLAWHDLFLPESSSLRMAVVRHNLLDVLALPSLAAELSFRVECPQENDEREHLAELHVEVGKDRASLERALEVDPDSFRARLELSKVVEREEGDLDAAMRHAELALEIAPDHLADAARRRIAQLKRRMTRHGFEGES